MNFRDWNANVQHYSHEGGILWIGDLEDWEHDIHLSTVVIASRAALRISGHEANCPNR